MHVIIVAYMHVSNLHISKANISIDLKAVMLYSYAIVS